MSPGTIRCAVKTLFRPASVKSVRMFNGLPSLIDRATTSS
jgi:hypothetical protein